jgi:hypothetical protein
MIYEAPQRLIVGSTLPSSLVNLQKFQFLIPADSSVQPRLRSSLSGRSVTLHTSGQNSFFCAVPYSSSNYKKKQTPAALASTRSVRKRVIYAIESVAA